MNLEPLLDSPLDDTLKGLPPGARGLKLRDVGKQAWNVLAQDLPLPLALLRKSALDHNDRWMREYLGTWQASLAPHGKTTMCPQLFAQQLAGGAWGITLATLQQVLVARRFGVPRIVLANQLVGPAAVQAIGRMQLEDPDFDFYCLVDSAAGVRDLAAGVERWKQLPPAAHTDPHPGPLPTGERGNDRLQVLLEIGAKGGRTGCRTVAEALELSEQIAATPGLALRGVEGFEGLLAADTPAAMLDAVRAFLDRMVEVASECDRRGFFAPGEVLLSAGGSNYYDLCVERLSLAKLSRPTRIVVRSGCYLTQDSQLYRQAHERLHERSPRARELGPGLQNALEVWSYVQSRPEPTRAVLAFGRRDAGFDCGLPQPLVWHRPDRPGLPQPLPAGHVLAGLNDQHALLDLPADSPLAVGDMVACGISHPCTTFDKWQFLPVVDDEYRVVGGVRTFF